MSKLIDCWFSFWFKERQPSSLALYRIIMFGSLLALFIIRYYRLEIVADCARWSPHGIYKWFHMPCSQIFINIVYGLGIVTSALATIGYKYRITGLCAAICATIFLGYDYNFHRVYHGLHMYVMVLLALGLSRAADDYSIDSYGKVKKGESFEYNWPIQFAKLYVVYVYTICGVEKLYFRGLDWVFSDNLFLVVFSNDQDAFLKDEFLSLPLPMVIGAAFWSVIVCELFAPLALINRKWGVGFWFIWISFHVGVYCTLGGHTYFFTQLIAATIFFFPAKPLLKA